MKKIALLLPLLLAACSHNPPSAQQLSQLPIYEAGKLPKEFKPEQVERGELILYFPASQEIPLRLKASGSLLASSVEAQTSLRLNKPLYWYQSWVSADGKHWQRVSDLATGRLTVSYDQEGLSTELIANEKNAPALAQP